MALPAEYKEELRDEIIEVLDYYLNAHMFNPNDKDIFREQLVLMMRKYKEIVNV